jgi:hypothetical protein
VGIAVRHRGIEPDLLQQGADARPDFLLRHDPVDLQPLGTEAPTVSRGLSEL